MFPTRFFQILFLVVAIGLATEASYIRDGGEVIRELVARQSGSDNNSAAASDTGSGSSPSTSAAASVPTSKAETTSAPASSAPATTSKESSTTKADPTTSKNEATSSSKADPTTSKNEVTSTAAQTSAAPTTSAIQTSNIASTSAAQISTTSTSEEASKSTSAAQSEEDKKTTSASAVVSTSYLTVTYTNSDGSQMVSTSAQLTTSTPDLTGSNDAPSGLSDKNKQIIGGVVGGVGGAILLGALALVAWRIRARKKLAEENDGLMEYNGGYTAVDKVEPGSATLPTTTPGRTPFQSTLENYHQPSQPVNASSNF